MKTDQVEEKYNYYQGYKPNRMYTELLPSVQ